MVYSLYTLCLFNIAIENGPFIDDFPIKTSIYKGFSMAMLNNQTVYIYIYIVHGQATMQRLKLGASPGLVILTKDSFVSKGLPRQIPGLVNIQQTMENHHFIAG